MKTRIVFFGTPEFAVPFLETLLKSNIFEVVAVVTQPDKPVGRKQTLEGPATKQLALKNNIPIYQWISLKKDESVFTTLQSINADIFVVVAYGKIIPQNILSIPQFGCVNVHPSLLPLYRGPSPIQQAILNNDKITGVSIMLLDEGMDTGPILAQEKINLDEFETYETLAHKIYSIAPTLLISTLRKWIAKEIKPNPQDNSKTSITRIIEREDGHITPNETATEIERKLRAYSPWPGIFILWKDDDKEKRLKIIKAKNKQSAKSGSQPKADQPQADAYKSGGKTNSTGNVRMESKFLVITCCEDELWIESVQPEGKKEMSSADFIRGNKSFLNSTFA